MPCLFPRNVNVKKVDGHFMRIPAPCGRCPECLKRQRQEWLIRNVIELNSSKNAFFITLTYDDEHLPISECNGKPCFSVRDIQLFLKRFRKQLNSTDFKYFLASEYGGQFGRPHYHAIFYNIPYEKVSSLTDLLTKTWCNGFISCSVVNLKRINYVCKYMLQKTQRKKDFADPAQAPFYLSSRRPAIGSSYLSDSNVLHHLGNKTIRLYVPGVGNTSLPSYYKRKIFDGYENIKEEIRNDYICKLHSDFNRSNSSTADSHKYAQDLRNHRKAVIRNFKKYQKQTFSEVSPTWMDFHLSTT